jgi:pilus assembly protein CpaB
MRNYILLALAILAGVLAFGIAKTQINKRYQELELSAKRIKVVVAKLDLTAGDTVTAKDLSVREIFANSAGGDEIRLEDVRLLVDQKLVANVKQNSPLRWRDLETGDLTGRGSLLANIIPQGERAMAIPVDSPSSVAGMIRPNDHVDILGTFRFPAQEGDTALDTVTLTLLQNVTVLAVGQQLSTTAEEGRRGASYTTLTLSITPPEAELLVFAQQKGKLTFTLRNPRDVDYHRDTKSINFDYLQQHLKDFSRERADRSAPTPAPRKP